MQREPESGLRVPADVLQGFITDLCEAAGTTREHADILARLLVRTDLRGIRSHGTLMASQYLARMRAGEVNPRPGIQVDSESTTSRVYDGDGGMGHWPCYEGTLWAIERAKEHGTAAVTTRNHFHFGSASHYTVMALEADCLGFAVSSHRWGAEPEGNIFGLIRNSPLSFGIPAGEQPPIVPDQGMNIVGYNPELFARSPAVYFKALGLSVIPQLLGGIMAGIWKEEYVESNWISDQGSFIAVFDLARFIPIDEFKSRVDGYIDRARHLEPGEGLAQAELPGGPEHQHEKEYGESGIPMADEVLEALEAEAAIVGIMTPFANYEETRFGPDQ